MHVETLRLRARPGHEAALEAWMADEAKRQYAANGCLSAFALRQEGTPVRTCVSFWIDTASVRAAFREGLGRPPSDLVEGTAAWEPSDPLAQGASHTPRLIYTGIRVTDIERSQKFYTEVLGFESMTPIRSNEKLQSKNVLLRNPKTGHQIELNWYTEGGPFGVPFTVGEGLDHIGIHVDDLPEFIERVKAHGGSVADLRPHREYPIEAGGLFRVAYLYDPDGHMLEAYDIRGVPVSTPFSGGY